MPTDYFEKTTEAQRQTIAQYLLNTVNEPRRESMTDEQAKEIIQEHSGDTHIAVIRESFTILVYLSVDSHIQVLNIVDKHEVEESLSFEVDELTSLIPA